VAGPVEVIRLWSGARVRNPGHRPGASGTLKGVDVQLASSPRRALGLLAAGTIGLSTALLGLTGVAQAATVPNAPTIEAIEGGNGSLMVFVTANDPADTDTTTPWADKWEYSVDGGATSLPTTDAGFTNGYDQNFLIDGLTNGHSYSVSIRGVSEGPDNTTTTDDIPGAWSAAVTGVPYAPPSSPGTPTVVPGPSSLKVSWAAAATQGGTYPVAKYGVMIPVDHGQYGGPEIVCETTALTCTLPVKAGVSYPVWVVAVDDHGNQSVMGDPVDSGVVPNPVAPATVPTKNGDLTLPAGSTSTVVPGKTMTVSGSGYAPNSTITLAIYSTPQVLTIVVTDASGNFTATVTVPAGLAAGNHTLVASGVDSSGNVRYVNLAVTVSGSGKATLAYTGADVALPSIVGLIALSLGTGLIVVRRRATRSAA
jgi:hypothetical protein